MERVYKRLGGLAILANHKKDLNEKVWFMLLEQRRELLKPHLREMTLPEIKELRFIEHHCGYKSLKREAPEVTGHFTLEVRGVFPKHRSLGERSVITHTTYKKVSEETQSRSGLRTPEITERFWGLTRD